MDQVPILHLGIGYTLKENIVSEIKNKELFELNVKDIPQKLDIGSLYNPNYLSCATKKFINML